MVTEFRYINTKMIDIRKVLQDLSSNESIQLELVFQLKRIADCLSNYEK